MKRTVTDREIEKLLKTNEGKGDPNIGQKVGNNIILVDKLGQGAMGAVYLGCDTIIKRWVAVKVLLRELFEVEAQFQYMKGLLIEEGRNIAKVQHPGIILVHGVDADYPALIMEYIDGMTFQDYLYQDEVRCTWGFPAFRQWFISKMLEVAEALRFAHAHGLIHKDLKPSNIMISQDEQGKWNKVTVIDFGLAQDNRRIKLTDGESVIGTPSYMASEQWADLWELDRRTDVFSFGVILYEILMRDEYHGLDADIPQIIGNIKNSGFLQSRVGHLPIDQRSIFKLCLAHDRAQRAGGMLEVIGLLKGLQDSMKDREREFPGTSFPLPPAPSRVAIPVEESAKQPPKPVSSQKPKPPMRGGTLLGPHASQEPVSRQKEQLPEMVIEPAPEPAMASVDFDEVEPDDKRTRKAIWIMLLIAAVLFTAVIPILYAYFNNDKATKKDSKSAPVAITKAPMKIEPTKIEPMAPIEVMKPDSEPKVTPTEPKVTLTEPKVTPIPSTPAPPSSVGEFPSNEYATHLFREWDKWCAQNDSRKAEFEKFPMWRALCLRKKAVELYAKDRSNPEMSIAMIDEIFAHMCFQEMVYRKQGNYVGKDTFLAKECDLMRDLAYKKFTHFIAGERIHAVDKFLTGRRPRRLQIQEEWKKANSAETTPATP